MHVVTIVHLSLPAECANPKVRPPNVRLTLPMGARRGALFPPLEFEKNDVIWCVPQNMRKHKKIKQRKSIRLRLRRAEKWSILVWHAENAPTFSSVGGFAPVWKISAGAH